MPRLQVRGTEKSRACAAVRLPRYEIHGIRVRVSGARVRKCANSWGEYTEGAIRALLGRSLGTLWVLLGYSARTSVEGPQVVGSLLGIGEATLPALQPENR